MRQLTILFFSSLLIFSCNNPPVGNNPTKDSVVDTSKKNSSQLDMQRMDTTHKTAAVENDCAVLKRVIPNDSAKKQIQRDLAEMTQCGVDSFDFLYVVPNLFPRWLSANHVQGKVVTYGDFLKHLNEFKTTDSYAQLHQRVLTLDSLKSIPFNEKNVASMKPVLGHLGFTEEEWEMFEGFSKTYPIPKKGGFTWGDMIAAFDKYNPIP